jgi:RNA polymerase sigma-70 factor (ECF subfamily)
MTAGPSTDQIWFQLKDDLRRFIRRRVDDDHVADDLLQETFLRIHRNISSLDREDRLAAWVYQIARNVISDHFRRGGKGLSLLPGAQAAGDGDDLDGFRQRAGVWLLGLVDLLPEKYRQAVQLSEVEGLSQQEVADRLGLSLSGAKSRIQRGRTMLRGILDQCCWWEFDRRGNIVGYDPKPDRTICRDCSSLDDPERRASSSR